MNRMLFVLVVMAFLAMVAIGAPQSLKLSPATPATPVKLEPASSAETSAPVVTPATDETDQVWQIGTTYSDFFSYGSANKYIARDSAGYLHVSWMNARLTGGGDRVVSYNYRNPSGAWSSSTGTPVFTGVGAGFNCSDVRRDGRAVVTAHRPGTSFGYTCVTGIDLEAYANALIDVATPACVNPPIDSILWPTMSINRHNMAHVFARERDVGGIYPYSRIYYSRTNTELETASAFVPGFNTYGISYATQTSRTTDNIAVAWPETNVPNGYENPAGWAGYLALQINNDLKIARSNDGGNAWNFANALNVTRFRGWQANHFALFGDTTLAAGDTFRFFNDAALVYDNNNQLHVVFVTRGLWEDGTADTTAGPPVYGLTGSASFMWHWSEANPDTCTIVADGWWNAPQTQAWRSTIDRPSIGVATNGDLYVVFTRYDYGDMSMNGWPCGDVYATVSANNGMSWYHPTNLTNTAGDSLPAGQAHNEIWPSVQEVITDSLFVSYIDDMSGGSAWFEEALSADWTLNPVRVMSVSPNQIRRDSLLLYPDYPPLHVQHLYNVSTPENPTTTLPGEYKLSAYPNPFNPEVRIQFAMPTNGNAIVKVFDVAGREIATLADGKYVAGSHHVMWKPANQSAGIYFVRMESNGVSS
ncbi:MAG: T9SS type A sorting domain-containing protein, partial [bacterium]|nr:T9SS type A sorting domain-containing protein [bacterium]